jgi:hypothetical protein
MGGTRVHGRSESRLAREGRRGTAHPSAFALPFSHLSAIKKTGHENPKKGLGFIALDPSLPRSRSVAPRAEEPEQELLCLLQLLWQELPHAFVTILNARRLPHVPSAPLEFEEGMCVQLFAACPSNRAYHSGTFNL